MKRKKKRLRKKEHPYTDEYHRLKEERKKMREIGRQALGNFKITGKKQIETVHIGGWEWRYDHANGYYVKVKT